MIWRAIPAACVLASLIFVAETAKADRHVALVVGNSKYEKAGPLPNAQRDAAAVADRLRDLGFEVTEVFDGDAFTLNRAADRFTAQAKNSDLALFYFAGHGIQLFDQNFLLARDADPDKITRVEDLGLDLNRFTSGLRRSGTIRQALLIDACRNNPFSFEETVRLLDLVRKAGAATASAPAEAAAGTRGLARVILAEPNAKSAGAETLFFFAAQPGQVSFDGAGQNSFYVEGLKEELSKPGRPLTETFRNVSAYVRTVTKGEQVPQVVSDWTADVVLGRRAVERVSYRVVSNANGELPKRERELVMRSATGFNKFSGDFIAKAGIGDLPSADMSEDEKAQAQKLGLVQGFTIKYDLDRDGRDETLHVFFQQTGYWLSLESQGVTARVSSCIDGDTPTAIEVGLRDLNGDRRPEVWIAYETEQTTGWGKFCILEYVGIPDLADRRRGSTGPVNLGFSGFRTLLRGEAGWNVSVANDNTIKVCGGSNCHTPWLYSYDGQKFRLLDNGGEKPSAVAAMPFADERERAANLYAALIRHAGPPLLTQSWRMTRNKTGVFSATARLAIRTELSYECSTNAVGALATEALILRPAPGQSQAAGTEIEIEPTLAYGEVAAQAPMLLDGAACAPVSISAGEGGEIHIGLADGQAGNCLGNLARAKTATLPLLHQGGLLHIRLDGAAGPLASTRSACTSPAKAAAIPPENPVTQPALGAPQRGDTGQPLARRARAFLEDYMQRTEGEAEQALTFVRNNFGAEIRYYGKLLANAQVVDEKRRYLNRWPQRRYRLKPGTMQIACEEERSSCRISGELDFDVRDPRAARVSSGSATYELRVEFTAQGPKIVEESGRTLARRN